MKLSKYENNPILTANEKNQWEELCVLNPAVIYDDEKQEFVMLYRAAGNDYEHIVHLGLATSKDGYNFTRQSDRPVFSPTPDEADGGCIEDPRLVKMGDVYYLTYASRTYAPGQYWSPKWKPLGDRPQIAPSFVSQNSTLTYLAYTRDFYKFKKLGRITDSRVDDRDVIIFPEAVNGRFVKLSRPMTWCGKGFENENPAIWISYSDDLSEWDKPELLMVGETNWESKKIGGSCPPLKTEFGWFCIYHGVSKEDNAYRVGAVILDINNPSKIIARTKDYIMEPEFEFETQGYYNGCVFPTGNCVVEGKLFVYYGAADKCVCVATCDFDELLNDLMENDKF